MGFDFTPNSARKKTRSQKAPISDYQARSKREQQRRKLVTCTAFYVVVCFETETDMQTMQSRLGDARKYIPACDVEEAVAALPKFDSDWRVTLKGCVAPDPTSAVTYVDDLEVDCKSELATIEQAFDSCDEHPAKADNVADSPYWFVIVGRDNDDIAEFAERHSLLRYGDKVLDGSRWLIDISD